jgi:hypothetical protein
MHRSGDLPLLIHVLSHFSTSYAAAIHSTVQPGSPHSAASIQSVVYHSVRLQQAVARLAFLSSELLQCTLGYTDFISIYL